MSSNRRQKGFSLLEAVIALGVASYALAATYDAFSGGIANLRVSNNRVAMVLFAEQNLARLSLSNFDEGAASGVTPQGFEWNRTITLYTEDMTQAGATPLAYSEKHQLYHIKITVNARSGAPIVLETLKRRNAGE